MKYTCKADISSFGYINTSDTFVTLEKGKEYKLTKEYDETMKCNYYKVYDGRKVITTISPSEFRTFFE